MTNRPVACAAAVLLVGSIALAADAEPEYPHGDFEGDCSSCHTDDGWSPARIEPKVREEHAFPLAQAHDLDDCRACHTVLDFSKASPECVDCHLDVHRGELGIDCATCHRPISFLDRTRMQRMHQATRFPLRGSHRSLDCEECHALQPPGALRWVNTPVECVDCHRDAYEANTQHVEDGFPLDCDFCHAPTVWQAARFNHAGIVDGCVNCHLDDYQGTNDPDHVANGFPTECQLCHTPGGSWEDADFDHGSVTAACVNCHLDDYQRTTDPNHVAAGFPTTCEDCHRPTNWNDADFDHESLFPIQSGRHAGLWDSCSTCHVNPSNYAQFSCFGCHPHSDRSQTDGNHSGVTGYAYDSNACYSCHPQGRN